jgi:hypothetical protein
MVDALKAGAMASHGHIVVRNYPMEDRIRLVRAPTLVLRAGAIPTLRPTANVSLRPLPAAVADTGGRHGPHAGPDARPLAAAVMDFLQRSC